MQVIAMSELALSESPGILTRLWGCRCCTYTHKTMSVCAAPELGSCTVSVAAYLSVWCTVALSNCWYFPYSNWCNLAKFLEGTVLNWWASLMRLVWVRASIEKERCLGGAVLDGWCPSWSGEAGFLLDGKPACFLPSWRDKWILSTCY